MTDGNGPGWFRQWGPALVLALIGSGLGVPKGPFEMKLGAVTGLVLGVTFFSPWRHYSRRRYRGTLWSIKVALALLAAAYLGQMFAGFVVGFVSAMTHGPAQPIAVMSPAILVAAMAVTTSTALLAVMILRLQGGPWWALGMQQRDLVWNMRLGLEAGLALAAYKLVYFKFFHTMDVWQLGGAGLISVFFGLSDNRQFAELLFCGAVLVPISEEILFRGVLYAALRRWIGPLSGAVISATIFGLVHWPDIWFPGFLGLVFAWIYHCTGSLWAPIAGHMIVNFTTLALSFDRARLTAALSWDTVGALILAAAVVQFLAMWVREEPPADCLCGSKKPEDLPRCPDCCYPMRGWPWWAVALLRSASARLLVIVGGCALALHWFIHLPYGHDRADAMLMAQHDLLAHTDAKAADRLLADWVRDRPSAVLPLHVQCMDAYAREDFREVVRLVEVRHTLEGGTLTCDDRNLLSLAYAELGGADAAKAVQLGEEALAMAPPPVKVHVEDTLGWALVRAGRLREAKHFLDRESEIYGMIPRRGMAELTYHRGVLLWALNERDRAAGMLRSAASLGEGGMPFSRRSAEILERGALPVGLVPPPALKDERKPSKP